MSTREITITIVGGPADGKTRPVRIFDTGRVTRGISIDDVVYRLVYTPDGSILAYHPSAVGLLGQE